MMTSKLLRNGTILSFDDGTQSVKVLHNADILIKDDEIVSIGHNIEASGVKDVLDVSGCICSPGFINTHSHLWQTAYRTMGPNMTLAEYFGQASQFSPAIKLFSPEDIYISCLEGYYEGLNGGVTAFLEHAHNNWELDVVKSGWDAAVDGGARVWWCPNVEDRSDTSTAEAQFNYMQTLGDRANGNHPLVSLGLAYDGFGGSGDDIDYKKKMIRKLHIEAITLHFIGGVNSPWPVGSGSPAAAAKANLQELDIPIVFSHGGYTSESDQEALREHNWNVSITPESEMHYGHGQVTSRLIQDQSSLGIDTNWTFSGDVLTQARLWLQNVRGVSYQNTLNKNLIPKESPMSVEDAFLLATRQGGRALRRDDVGVLKVGAKADIVVFSGDSPNMAGWTDPIAAAILHANVGDIKHVLVGGEFRKREGQLVLKNGSWAEFRKTFEETARRIQGEYTERPPLGEKFFGSDFGDVETMTTRR